MRQPPPDRSQAQPAAGDGAAYGEDAPRTPATRPASDTPVPIERVEGGWRDTLRRGLLAALAVASLGMAVIGAVVPGLPSTVFVLISAWAAARSSPRLHAWLHRSRLFGPTLHNWHNGRKVTRRGKWGAGISMAVCAVILIWTVPQRWVAWFGISCMAVVLLWLCRRPEP